LRFKLLALSPQCQVEAGSEIKDLGEVAAESSMAWLQTYMASADRLAEQALAAIATHEGGVKQLIEVAENRRLPLTMRERALFWMAQSDSDEAFDYVALLLNRYTGSRQSAPRQAPR
jgi:hypothetical protein